MAISLLEQGMRRLSSNSAKSSTLYMSQLVSTWARQVVIATKDTNSDFAIIELFLWNKLVIMQCCLWTSVWKLLSFELVKLMNGIAKAFNGQLNTTVLYVL